MLLYSGHEAFKSPRGECSVGLWIGCDLPQLFDVPILLCPQLTGIWFPAGASSSLSVITPQKLFRVYPGQTAFLRLSLQFRQPEWKYFHAKWRFLTKNVPVLYCAAECKAGSSSANHTCEYTVEKDGAYEARVDVQEGCSLVLMDVWPEDAGKYEVRVLALDESGSASLEVDVLEGLPSSDLVSWPLRAISAAVHHTAWLPIQPLDHAWTFLIIKWEFVTTNRSRPILVYFVDSCNGTIGEWWERECTIHKTVAVEYQQRVNILRNGTLVIHSVDFKDAGVYQATIWTSSGKVQAAVNLTVIPGQKACLDNHLPWTSKPGQERGRSSAMTGLDKKDGPIDPFHGSTFFGRLGNSHHAFASMPRHHCLIFCKTVVSPAALSHTVM
ncbi:uncharacterized protein LOC125443018 isoform X4 [Sphaerodactylus townsendi]|uniref:uncharacterized protein LOC125443018 isoform X4 n=1 Tax=Sphaerodactylus townsendi TaxID=933632 RepID=UPI0020265094|nr:uncharacterized protein LOC125443018 isoform X4 [Sphaerodactylus townsendi]